MKNSKDIGNSAWKAYRERIKAIRDDLPRNWRDLVVKELPQYDTRKGVARMNNVFMLLASDETLTPVMEKIARNHRAQPQKQAI